MQLLASSVQQRPLSTAAIVGIAGSLLTVVVSKYTLVHPYMLADNRSAIPCRLGPGMFGDVTPWHLRNGLA